MHKIIVGLKLACLVVMANLAVYHGNAQATINNGGPLLVEAKAGPGNLPEGLKKQTDEDAYTQYAVYNDSKALCIKLYITDSLQKQKVLKNGLELWIDVKAKKNKVTGILFPLSIRGDVYPGGGNRIAAGGPPSSFQTGNGNKKLDTSLQELVEKRKDVELKGFVGEINGKQPIQTMPPGFFVGLRITGDTLIYEAAVPLNAIAANLLVDKAVSIGIIEKGIELPGFGDMEGGPGGDGGGPPGGGDGGGPPPLPPPGGIQDGGVDFRRLFETNVIWCKLKLHN